MAHIYTLGHRKGANLFLSVTSSKINGFAHFVKNQEILMQFSLLDLQMNNTCEA